MNIKPIWVAILLSALGALLWVWWVSSHDRVWSDRQEPVEGEASYNDYYVVQQALRAQGVQVQSLPHLDGSIEHWSDRDSLMLGSDLRTLAPTQVDAILEWVARGGRLLVASGSRWDANGNSLLNRIGIIPSNDGMWCVRWLDSGPKPSTGCFGTFAFAASERENFQLAVGNANNGWIMARRSWGLGQIEVVGSLFRLQNHALNDSQESDWAWQLLAPMLQGGVFHIVYQTELPPLYVYLVRYGWYSLLPLLCALLAWLWTSSQRFGPPLPLPAADRRALGEHIQASGEYLYRRGLIPALYAPLRRRFDELLRRRHPALAALPPAEIAQALAQRYKLPLESVRLALQAPKPRRRKAFLAAVQTLLHLMREL